MKYSPASEAPLAVVTGASGALGAAINARLREHGWKTIATYRTRPPHSGERAVSDTTWVHFDTAVDASADALRDAVETHAGCLRAVFACVGAPSTKRAVADTPVAEFEAVHQANVLSLVRTWHALAHRARRDNASVLAVGSDAGRAARARNGPYSTAKAALESLVSTLAKEEQPHGVRVNLLAPSLIDSPLAQQVMSLKGVTDPESYYRELPWARPLSLDEVAAVCIDIATTPQWAYATGQTYPLGAAL
ncbi:SDR family NAD(P)-dependent oxidoreductase [Streptomyces sp. RTd22]|uniref:SDR family NAD(P)-dependent oxidoreductase n=1 Tax=Streptomyces sp. RTd22 TaxID=1841249 RepID=UPI0007C4662B|nr:SDR family oxidoreductase [Streptomyces sp. RTd22]